MTDVAVGARRANSEDLVDLARLYRVLEREMVSLRPIWALTDGLPAPEESALDRAVMERLVIVGTIDEVVVGFLIAGLTELLPQAGGERTASIDLVFTEHDARGIGVGEAMLDTALGDLRTRGIRRFDVAVLPGHRPAKNFFEAHGFKARSIIMHHEDL
ncbi:MAG: GNAT family N-acetyltransferase [Gammaproteobacteria bacterium]|nr:GNAT family N-acetyltransferase [Gammaproteobacteria bacterium]